MRDIAHHNIRVMGWYGRFYVQVRTTRTISKFNWKRFRFEKIKKRTWRDLSISGAIHYPDKYPFPYPKHAGFDTLREAMIYANNMTDEKYWPVRPPTPEWGWRKVDV